MFSSGAAIEKLLSHEGALLLRSARIHVAAAVKVVADLGGSSSRA
jgi:hypothetical protein